MRLYTNTGTRSTRDQCNMHDVGLLMVAGWRDPDKWPFFAVDNGCFAAWKQGVKWNPRTFMSILNRCREEGRRPDFIVIPDLVGSRDSLSFSATWYGRVRDTLPDAPLYLAVQDGMEPWEVKDFMFGNPIQGIFVGGTMDWKLEHMAEWARFAHDNGLQCHVGRIGPIKRMMLAELAGADSIDSTTWVQRRNGFQRYIIGFKQQTRIDDERSGGAE